MYLFITNGKELFTSLYIGDLDAVGNSFENQRGRSSLGGIEDFGKDGHESERSGSEIDSSLFKPAIIK